MIKKYVLYCQHFFDQNTKDFLFTDTYEFDTYIEAKKMYKVKKEQFIKFIDMSLYNIGYEERLDMILTQKQSLNDTFFEKGIEYTSGDIYELCRLYIEEE